MIILCTKPLHNSLCIHFDAFWCILMHLEHSDVNVLFLASNSPFLAHFDIQKHFYDKFVYKNFLQFILHTFSCILIHIDAFWTIKINKNHFFDNFVHKNFAQLIVYAFYCICKKCIKMHPCASKCINMHQNASMFIEFIVQMFCVEIYQRSGFYCI